MSPNHTYTKKFAGLLLILCALGSLSAGVTFDASIPRVAFAAQEIEDALAEAGKANLKVTMSIKPDNASPEAFTIRTQGANRISVVGTDASGAMYGGLEIADSLRLGLPIRDVQRTPFVGKRGIKFNIPWDARTPSYDDTGDSAQNNIETIWDIEFWKAYLDDLARYRYNVLSLWSTHPYSNLIKLEDYPDTALDDVYRIKDGLLKPHFKNKLQNLDQNGDVCLSVEHDSEVLELVKRLTIDEKIDHWQRVFNHARDRGIEIQLFHWNVFTFGATGKHGITQDQTNPTTVDYTRKAVREVLLTYPQITTIGITAGENADKALKGEHSTENFLFNTFGQGIMDAQEAQPGREVRLIIRRHATEQELVTKAFKGRYTGGILDTSVKYAVAHIYSSRRPQEWEKRIIGEGWLDKGYKVWLNLRNDDIFMHRWGSPDYVRQFIKWMPHADSPGFYMGSDGYVWAREFIAKNPEMAGRLEIDKHWYRFRLWGQLAYNNDLGKDYWEAVLRHRFPGVDAGLLLDAWETVSEVIPQLNRSVWAPTDGDFSAEGVIQRDGFLTLDDYHFDRDPMPLKRIKHAPDPQCISVTDWAKAFLAGKSLKGVTPLQVADNLDGYAAVALKALPMLRTQAKNNTELQETLNDIESMAYLGRYYADKMRGAARLALFRRDTSLKHYHAEAVRHLEEAAEEWQAYAAILTPQYKTQLLARTHFLDWNATLKEVAKEVIRVKQEGDFPEVRFANLKDGAQLPAGSDLRVEIAAADGDGIKRVRFYLNGLLMSAEKDAKAPYVWSSASDKLLQSLKPDIYHLVAVATDKTGTESREEIQITVGDVPENAKPDGWTDEIHQIIMKDGDRMMAGDMIPFPRLECKVRVNRDGKFILYDDNVGLIFKTWSKDDDGPHFAELKEGRLITYRGTPANAEVVLWDSPKARGSGPFKLGITRAKRLVIFSENGGNMEVTWRGPQRN